MNRQALKSAFDERPTLTPQDSSALIFIDVDDFKKVNDHLGHKAGDQVLVYIADWMRKLAPKKAKIARMGGDEFVIFCPHYHEDSVQQFADSLLSQAYQPIRLENGEANIGFSIGVCQFSGAYKDFEILYEHADQAMYQVKRNGKNGVSFVSI
jgi:diguanylate cyclase (GGDEF)-like protein